MLRIIIVDDETGARQSLSNIIRAKCSGVEILEAVDSVNSALEAIEIFKPDLVFLDIQLGNESGFDLLEKTGQYNFEVIFTTAYDQYAIRAIKFAALDYLLKPIDANELIAAVKRAEEKKMKILENNRVAVLLNNRQRDKVNQTIGLPTMQGFDFVEINDIIRAESTGNYTIFYLKGNIKFLFPVCLKNLKNYWQMQVFFVLINRI